MVTELNKEEIGKRLKEFGLTKYGKQKEFAEKLGLSPSALHSGYFAGRHLPGTPMIAKLLLMGCDIRWLLLGEGEMKSSCIAPETDEAAQKLRKIEQVLNGEL